MFGKLFGRFAKTEATATSQHSSSPAEAALLRHIAEKSDTDPLLGPKLGAREVIHRMLSAMKTDRGVHIESILCALGAVAGYACQASVRALSVARGLDETALLMRVESKDGATYYFGDELNKPLAESEYSIWKLAAGGAQSAGCRSFPSLEEIFKHVSETVGSPEFGKPRLPNGHPTHELPLTYLKAFWPVLQQTIKKFCLNPEQWPILVGLSIQEVIIMGKQALDPCTALRVVMESAVPMSKIELCAQ